MAAGYHRIGLRGPHAVIGWIARMAADPRDRNIGLDLTTRSKEES